MKITIAERKETSLWMNFVIPLIAMIFTILLAAILFSLMGENGFTAVKIMFFDPFFDPYNFPEVFVKAAPMILIALGLSIGFRANIWNIGAEGQFILGAIGATWVAMSFYPEGGIFALPLMMIAAMLFGAAYALIVAFLRVKFGVSEILVSLMLVYVAEQILNLVIRGPLQDPDGLGFPKSRAFQDDALMPILIEGTRVHLGVLLALLLAGVFAFLFHYHKIGFDIRVAGLAPRAAKFSGGNEKQLIYFALGIGGALAGLAGCFDVAGPAGVLDENIAAGYGFTAIIVAFLGRLNPFGIVFAALVIAATTVGGGHFLFPLPPDAVLLVQGLMLFLLLALNIMQNFTLIYEAD